MQSISCNTIGESWLSAVSYVLSNGSECIDGSGHSSTEVIPLTIHINKPTYPDRIIEQYGSQESIDYMLRNFFDENPIPAWGYSYAQRLFNYNGNNQIQFIIERLLGHRASKSSTLSVLFPNDQSSHIPCLCSLDFKIRGNALKIISFFRSQDIYNKMYADAYCIYKIGQQIASEVKCDNLEMYSHIASAHIHKPDIENAKKLILQKVPSC